MVETYLSPIRHAPGCVSSEVSPPVAPEDGQSFPPFVEREPPGSAHYRMAQRCTPTPTAPASTSRMMVRSCHRFNRPVSWETDKPNRHTQMPSTNAVTTAHPPRRMARPCAPSHQMAQIG